LPANILSAAASPKAVEPAPKPAQQALEASVSTLQETRSGPAQASPEAQDTSWKRFWSRSKVSAPSGEVLASPSAERGSSLARPSASARTRSLVPSPVLGAAASLPAWAGPLLKAALPYLQSAGVLAATWAVSRLVSAGLEKLWQWKGYEKNSLIVLRLLSNILVWGGGATLALNTAGMEWQTLLAGLGIGGLAVSMSVKKFVGNLIHGAIVLLDHPFHFGETVRIGRTQYVVEDMTYRYLVLRRADAPGSHTLMDYSTLAGVPIHLSHRLETGSQDQAAPPVRSSGPVARFRLQRALMLLGAAGVLYGGYALYGAAAAARPFLNAALGFGGFWLAAQGITFLHEKIADLRGWDPRVSPLVRLALRGALYAAGAVTALSLAGVSWPTLLASAGVLSVAAGVAASDFIANLLEAGSILLTQPFKVGDRVRVGEDEGRVADMTLRYVVLEAEKDGGIETTLLPYSLIGSSTLTVYKDYPKNR